MFCPNCGKQLSDESMFCGNCGTAVSKVTLPVEPNPVIPPVEEAPITTEAPPAEVAPVVPLDLAATQPIPDNIDETLAFAPYMAAETPQPGSFVQDLPEEQSLFATEELPPVPAEIPCEEPPVPVAPPQEPVYQAPVYPEPVPVAPVAAPAPAPKQKNVAIIVLLSVLCCLVLALAIYFVCLMFPDMNLFGPAEKREKSSSSQRKEEEEEATLPEDNKYAPYFSKEQPYILENSDTVYYGRQDLMREDKLISLDELKLALQEIYARHGDTTDDEELQAYFEAQPWYEENSSVYTLNDCEKSNELLLCATIAMEENKVELNRNPYLAYIDDKDFMLSYTSTDYIHKEDVSRLDKLQLILVKNGIYARKGYIFEDKQLQEFFYCMDWYVPNSKVDVTKAGVLNHYEESNCQVLDLWVIRETGMDFSSDNPYQEVYDLYPNYVFKYSSSSSLNEQAVYGLSLEELCIARNEILARHGYTFTDEQLLEYFLQRDWYQPTLPPGNTDAITLTDIERENIDLIRDAEEEIKAVENLDTRLTYTVTGNGYSVKLPAYWSTHCKLYSDSEYLGFYEKQSHSTAGGHLFTLKLYATDEDYRDAPNYSLLGYLTDSNGVTYHLVAHFPTDVQYEPQSATMYRKMRDEFDRISTTITPASGYTYTKA